MIYCPDYFKLDGVSSDKYGLYVNAPPMPPLAKRKTSSVDLDLSHENIIINQNYFENVEITLECSFFEKPDNINALYSWITSAKKLETSRFTKFYYKIKSVKNISPTYKGSDVYALNITFTCSPYRYKDSSKVTAKWGGWSAGTLAILNNNGSVTSLPIIEIQIDDASKILMTESYEVANETFANYIYFNNKKFGFILLKCDVPVTVTIDCFNKITYDSNNNMLLTFGNYPEMQVGKNTIGTGNKHVGDSVTIDTQERYI